MELQEIRYFLALSERLNFTKAAEACHVSQPALTRAIKKMEDELGGLLFSREPNNTRLTQLGCLMAPHLSEVMAHTRKAKQTATQFLKLERATLAIGVMRTIAPSPFIRFLDRFRTEHPGVRVTLLDATPQSLCEGLSKGELDMALLACPEGYPPHMRARELYSERFVIACGAGHRLANRDQIALAELDGEICFSRPGCEFHELIVRKGREEGVNLIQSYQIACDEWILEMVSAGLGLCFLPEHTAAFPGVVGCSIVAPEIQRSISLITVAGRRASAPASAFVQATVHHCWPSAARS